MKNTVLDKLYKYRYVILFVLLYTIFYFVPYTADDLRWGSFYGERRMQRHFYNYGGRYLGYMLSLALTRSVILKSVFMSAVTAGMVCYVEKISRQKCAFYITLILIAVSAPVMLRQSVAWLSGFVNYTVSVLLALIFIDYIYKVFRGEETKDTKSGIALFAVLGFASALLVEHFTLYCAVIAAGLMIYVKAKKQKIQIKNFTYLAGVLAGAVLMFSNSAYIKIFSGKDFYRKTINEDIDRASESARMTINLIRYGFLENVWFCLIMLAVIIILFAGMINFFKKSEKNICIVAITVSGIIYIFNAAVFMTSEGLSLLPQGVIVAEGVTAAAFTWIVIIMLAKKADRLWESLFCLLSIAALSLPFLFIHPFTTRCLFGEYMIYVLQTCLLTDMLPQKWKDKVNGSFARALYTVVLLTAFVFYLTTYISVNNADKARLTDIKNAYEKGVRTLQIQHLPDETFVHKITPDSEHYQIKGYKDFYNLPEDLVIKGNP